MVFKPGVMGEIKISSKTSGFVPKPNQTISKPVSQDNMGN